jgi:hypothetical protein
MAPSFVGRTEVLGLGYAGIGCPLGADGAVQLLDPAVTALLVGGAVRLQAAGRVALRHHQGIETRLLRHRRPPCLA